MVEGSGSWSVVDLSSLIRGNTLELFTKKSQLTNNNQYTYSSTSNYQSTDARSVSLILGSPNSSIETSKKFSSAVEQSPITSPQLVSIPQQSTSVIPQTSGSSNIFETLIGNASGVLIIGGLGFVAYKLLIKKK